MLFFLIIFALFLLKSLLEQSLEDKALRYIQLTTAIKQLQRENRNLENQLLTAAAFTTLFWQASKRGFIPARYLRL